MARVAGRNAAKHCAHMRRVGGHIRRHHHNIARRQRRAGSLRRLAIGQQLVVQDFHFALAAVGKVKTQRVIVRRHWLRASGEAGGG